MTTLNPSPGPDANHAFRLGIYAAVIVAVVGLAALYWTGLITMLHVAVALFLGFPIYLVLAAVVLSVWLGFDKDATDLRPVYREKDGV